MKKQNLKKSIEGLHTFNTRMTEALDTEELRLQICLLFQQFRKISRERGAKAFGRLRVCVYICDCWREGKEEDDADVEI